MNKDEVINKNKIDELNKLSFECRMIDSEKSIKYASKARELSTEINYTEGLATSILNLAYANFHLCNLNFALEYSLEARELFKNINDVKNEAKSIYLTGAIYKKAGKFKPALDNLINALIMQRNINDIEGESATLNKIGEIYTDTGKYKLAKEYLFEALRISREINNRRFESIFSNSIGILFRKVGDYTKALDYIINATEIAREINDLHATGCYLSNIGNIFLNLKNYDKALEYYNKGLKIERETNNKIGESNTLIGIGNIFLLTNKPEEALECFNKCLKIKKEKQDKKGLIQCYSGLADYYEIKKDFISAEKYHKIALECAIDTGDKLSEIQTLHSLSSIYLILNRLEESMEMLNKALEHSHKINAKREISVSHDLLSRLYEKIGDLEKSLFHIKKHHEYECEIYNSETVENACKLSARIEIEQAHNESELYKLKFVELANALENLETANKYLNEISNEKDELIGIVAHDLRNPLSNIMTSADMLINDYQSLSDEEFLEILGYVKTSSEQMFELIKKLLDVNTIESGKLTIKFEDVNVNELVKKIINDFKSKISEKNINVNLLFTGKEFIAKTDKTALEMILNNLISNAIKFSPHGKNIYINISQNPEFTKLEIIDEGPGFSDEDRKKLYKKFSRLSARPTGNETSTGLGLSIVRKLIDNINARIECESEYGKGTRFIIELPVNN